MLESSFLILELPIALQRQFEYAERPEKRLELPRIGFSA
jgi:hypothetical protein